MQGPLTNKAERRKALTNAFRSFFVKITIVLATILANFEPRSPLNIWKEHRNIFISEICDRFRRYLESLRTDSKPLVYMLLEVKNYFSDMVNTSSSRYRRLAVHEGLSLLTTKLHARHWHGCTSRRRTFINFNSTFNTEERHVFRKIYGAILSDVTLTRDISPLPSYFLLPNNQSSINFSCLHSLPSLIVFFPSLSSVPLLHHLFGSFS